MVGYGRFVVRVYRNRPKIDDLSSIARRHAADDESWGDGFRHLRVRGGDAKKGGRFGGAMGTCGHRNEMSVICIRFADSMYIYI